MKVDVLAGDEKSIRFMLSDVSPTFANAIRRTIIAEVPTMAIDDVVIYENTSIMYDEILANRLGLIPLTTDLDSYVPPEGCECKSELGCSRCRVTLTLEAEGIEETVPVYSSSLKSEDPKVKPTSEKILIVKLAPKQRLKLEAYARLGRGVEHAKWQPVTVCAYKYLPLISINMKKCDLCGKCVEFCPKKILAVEGPKLTVKDSLNCTLCLECVRHCPVKPSPLKVEGDDSAYIFYVESLGSVPINRIVTEAARRIADKSSTFLKEFQSIKEGGADEK